MSSSKTKDMRTDQLVSRFAAIGVEQGDALLHDETSRFNRLYEKMEDIDNELRERGIEARLALLALYSHPNLQVRLKAAVRTLGISPLQARAVLEEIRASGEPQALDAGMVIRGLDDGSFKPT